MEGEREQQEGSISCLIACHMRRVERRGSGGGGEEREHRSLLTWDLAMMLHSHAHKVWQQSAFHCVKGSEGKGSTVWWCARKKRKRGGSDELR